MDHKKMFKALVENAFDFLNTALEEFETKPKYSVIHFNAAVELFLKARLMAEHWSLLVAPRFDADAEKFESGEFQSVTMAEAAKRLAKIVGQPLSPVALEQFTILAAHRNKMIHFFHADTTPQNSASQIPFEQLRAWYLLNRLLEGDWKAAFTGWENEIAAVAKKLRGHHEYFRIHFEQLAPEIQARIKKGATIIECPMCEQKGNQIEKVLGDLLENDCLVCGFEDRALRVPCPDCSSPIVFVGEAIGSCEHCFQHFNADAIAAALDETEHDGRDGGEPDTPAHCVRCRTENVVATYSDQALCTACFAIYDLSEIERCHYCNDPNAGSMEESYVEGCVACSGRWEDLRDE